MSDSQRLHTSLLSVLEPELRQVDARNVDTLAWMMTGLILQKRIRIPAWASIVPSESEAAAREQGFRRWLKNPAIDVRACYHPFISQGLQRWQGQTILVALDSTSVADRLVVVRTALIYRRRAVPLVWQVFKRRSVMLAFEQYAELIQATAALLPAGVQVIVLGDRGFRDIRLMRLLSRLSWHFRLRLPKNEWVSLGRQPRRRLESWPLAPYQPRFLSKVRLTEQRYGPLHLALVWDGDPRHDPWRLASDQPTSPATLSEYAQRMGIESGFLDDKSAGFQLQETELLSPARLNRLLLGLALCNLYLVSVGTEVVAAGHRRLVDHHWQRGLSYLQLGWRWLEYSLARDAPIPFHFHLDPAPDPEPTPSPTLWFQPP